MDNSDTLTLTGQAKLRLIQWIDDASDVIANDDVVLTIDGIAITAKPGLISVAGVVAWEIGPFNPGIPIESFVVTTCDHGKIVAWFD